MRCGLLGEKLSHSYSPQIHSYLADYTYELFEVPKDNLADFVTGNQYDAINVTIPYKKAVIPYLTELSPRAQALGAVNTLVRRQDGSLIGHNTDYFGFSSMLTKSGLSVEGKKVLVLGSGGASVTATAVLQDLGARVVVISRSGENNYETLHRHADASIIVNATPVGMFPNNGVAPVNISQFTQLEGVLDMIYNPARTKLLMDAENAGLIAENGLWMLIAQAKESATWFTGSDISDDVIPRIYSRIASQMQNIVLIGMPGCGKTTIGRLLAEKTGRHFIDADYEIEKYAQKAIPSIFDEMGESGFRAIESAVLKELCKQSGAIIATGGGCVTRDENYGVLHQNSRILWIKRDISRLPTDGRPLSQAGKLEEMYRIRKPLYERFSDAVFYNHNMPNDTVNTILQQEVHT